MKVVCRHCGSEAHSKCPSMRSIFPSSKSEAESNFWQGMGFSLKDGELALTMLAFDRETDAEALERLFRRIRAIPEDQLDTYYCKHVYEHTMNCVYCGHKV